MTTPMGDTTAVVEALRPFAEHGVSILARPQVASQPDGVILTITDPYSIGQYRRAIEAYQKENGDQPMTTPSTGDARAEEPAACVVPYSTPSGKRVALNTAFQDLPIGTNLYVRPAADSNNVAEKIVEAVAKGIAVHDFGADYDWAVEISIGTARAAIEAYRKARGETLSTSSPFVCPKCGTRGNTDGNSTTVNGWDVKP